MKTKIFDNYQTRFDLIRAMLTHVPFDGWTWEAMEQGAIDIGYQKKKTSSERIKIFKDLFKNGSIDFIDIFSDIIDLEVKEKYNSIEAKPERVPEKIKKEVGIRQPPGHPAERAFFCQSSVISNLVLVSGLWSVFESGLSIFRFCYSTGL